MDKRELREKMKGITISNQGAQNKEIAEKVINHPQFKASERIFVYINTKNEVSTYAIIRRALLLGKAVYVPKIIGDGVMKACQLRDLETLVPGKFGIPTAPEGAIDISPYALDLIIVPGAAFTAQGKRLGRGGGYYDRFLERTLAYKMGVCFYEQVVDELPVEGHDATLDEVIFPDEAPVVTSSPERRDDNPSVGSVTLEEPLEEELAVSQDTMIFMEGDEEMSRSDMEKTRKINLSDVRKKKKKKGRLSPKAAYWIFVLAMSMLLSACVITTVDEVFSLSYSDQKVTFTIPEGADLGDTIDILEDADLISNKLLYRVFFWLTAKGDVMPGEYTANTYYDYRTITKLITRRGGARQTVRVTIPEGYEVKQIVDLLVKKGVSDRESIEEVLKNEDFDYDFLKGLPKGDINRLEGYLYPDTYEFYVNGDPKTAIGKMLKNFDNKFDQGMINRAKALNMSIHEVVTLASIIEREATSSDRATISSVFHNRLSSGSYPYLESCATVQYILGERKARITIADTEIDNPYNTYKYRGLPPGPIASPGLESLNAALYPEDTDYLFFAVSEKGEHAFSKTYEEHIRNANINPK